MLYLVISQRYHMLTEKHISLSWRCHGNGLHFGQNMALNEYLWKIVKICPKSPRFTDTIKKIYCWHVTFASKFPLFCMCYNFHTYMYTSTGNLLMRGPPSRGGFPLKKRGARAPLMRGLFTLHYDYRRKNQNCKKRQWCLWRFMGPLSMHQFIENSICALENKIFLFSNAQIEFSMNWFMVMERGYVYTWTFIDIIAAFLQFWFFLL